MFLCWFYKRPGSPVAYNLSYDIRPNELLARKLSYRHGADQSADLTRKKKNGFSIGFSARFDQPTAECRWTVIQRNKPTALC